MTDIIADPYANMRAKMAHMEAVIQGKYKPEETQEKMAKLENEIRKLCNELLNQRATLFNHFRLSDALTPKLEVDISDTELNPLLELAFRAFPQGANGQQLADFIGDYRVTSQRIGRYHEETHLLVRTGNGLETRYRFATPVETEEKRKEVEESQALAEAEIKAEAKAAAAAAKKKVKGKKK